MMLPADDPVIMGNPTLVYECNTTLSSMPCGELSGPWAWNAWPKNQQTLCHAQGFKDVYIIGNCNASASPGMCDRQSMVDRKCRINMSSKVIARPSFKRVAPHDKQLDSPDNSYAMDEGKEIGTFCKARTSKNLMSERKRRKKLNERLYSLRTLVPNISKMGKASIVGDAIDYVQSLQTEVDKVEEDIVDLQTRREGPAVAGAGDGDPKRNNFTVGFQNKAKMEHLILELEVSQMEEHIYHLRIHCKKTLGVLVQLTRAIEALEFEILNANISSVDDHILNTVVVEVKDGLVTKSEELRSMARAVVPKFGFSLC